MTTTHERQTLWTRGFWTFELVTPEYRTPYFRLIKDGANSTLTNYPVLHDDGTVGYDHYGVPEGIQKRVQRTMVAHKKRTETTTVQVSIEYTDTFGGEANYSWVQRHDVTVPTGTSDLSVVRLAKKLCGLSGVRCKREEYAGLIRLTPYNTCTTMFIEFN